MMNASSQTQRPLRPHHAQNSTSPPPQPRDPANSAASPAAGSSMQYAYSLMKEKTNASTADEIDTFRLRGDLETQAPRRWQVGDVYAPHDLTGVEARKWKPTRRTPGLDVFDTLGLNPLREYKNFAILSQYISEMGYIKHSRLTGLRPPNHRKVAKAIRRAIGIGIMPSVHIHPELIRPSHGGLPF